MFLKIDIKQEIQCFVYNIEMESCEILSNGECAVFDIKWNMDILSNDMSGRPFIVWYASDETYHYYKPFKQYNKTEFEQLFMFQMGSPDYDEERIVRYFKQ